MITLPLAEARDWTERATRGDPEAIRLLVPPRLVLTRAAEMAVFAGHAVPSTIQSSANAGPTSTQRQHQRVFKRH